MWFWGAKCNINTPDSRDCEAPEATTPAQPVDLVDPISGAVPLGATQSTFPFRNSQLQDVPNNWDYTFRAGIFAGDYSGVAVGPDEKAWAIWTDSRNGRSSRNQLGRNPLCEQSDIFGALVSLTGDNGQGDGNGDNGANNRAGDLNAFATAQCPTASVDNGSHGGNGDHAYHGDKPRRQAAQALVDLGFPGTEEGRLRAALFRSLSRWPTSRSPRVKPPRPVRRLALGHAQYATAPRPVSAAWRCSSAR